MSIGGVNRNRSPGASAAVVSGPIWGPPAARICGWISGLLSGRISGPPGPGSVIVRPRIAERSSGALGDMNAASLCLLVLGKMNLENALVELGGHLFVRDP